MIELNTKRFETEQQNLVCTVYVKCMLKIPLQIFLARSAVFITFKNPI